MIEAKMAAPAPKPIKMSILRVRLNKLSSDWHIARALLEDEYECIDRASNKIITRYEFAVHLLDVHRMWCSACTHPACLGGPPDRDAAAGGSAAARLVQLWQCQQKRNRKSSVSASTQTTDSMFGFQSDAPDIDLGLLDNNVEDYDDHKNNISETAFPLAMTNHGEDVELQTDVSTASTEKPPDERDVQSHLELTNRVSYLHLLIKQEGPSQEYCNVDMDNSRNESTSQQRREEGIPIQDIRSDMQSDLEWTHPVSDILIKQEGPSQERCDIDMDSSRNESTSHQGHEEGIPKQDIGSDVQSELDWTNHVSDLHVLIKQEGPSQERSDVNMDSSRNESTSHQGHEEGISTQDIGSDVQSELDWTNQVSDLLVKQEGPSQEHSDADMDSSRNQSKSHQGHGEATSTQHSRSDEKMNMDSNIEPSNSTHYDDHSAEGSSQDRCEAGMDGVNNVQNTSSRPDIQQSVRCSDHNKRCMRACHKHPIAPTCQKPLQCSECKQDFSKKRHLESHMRTHTGENAFTINGQRSQHLRTHTGKKPCQCSVCYKAFTSSSCLSRHMRLHTGVKPYQCSACNKTFARKSHLSQHIRIHTGEKPYLCSVCNKAFTSNSSLLRHLRLHTGNKSPRCSVCNKAFTSSGNISRHMRLHTGEKPYSCSVCNKAFIRNSHLSQHMRKHSGDKPYQCSVCNKAFPSNSSLSRHLRLHKGDEPCQS